MFFFICELHLFNLFCCFHITKLPIIKNLIHCNMNHMNHANKNIDTKFCNLQARLASLTKIKVYFNARVTNKDSAGELRSCMRYKQNLFVMLKFYFCACGDTCVHIFAGMLGTKRVTQVVIWRKHRFACGSTCVHIYDEGNLSNICAASKI